ncbi:MAG: alpha-amylase family glycosyl hydrolase [Candidatus Electrothrix sp. GW3-4]|uniref:alpha-amylase family glycosyl hydrolase n=1 Tax=Candidatus Electrothrix sp. GW3-4 TaxID=3126740 RepID=UPI0030D47EC7
MTIQLSDVGASVSGSHVQFGIYLPGVTPGRGYSVEAFAIHLDDQFDPAVPAQSFTMNYTGGPHDLWSANGPLTGPGNFGAAGLHLYRYRLLRNGNPVVFAFADPFAREAGPGTFSAFTVGGTPFAWTDGSYQTPALQDLVVYELNVDEFAKDFYGVIKRLDYLSSLGVNVLELMPFTNVKEDTEWGYTPLAYLAADDRYGGLQGLKMLVNACHARDIAVILDAVYAHAHPEFAYNLAYEATGLPNPMMGPFVGEFFPGRPGTDYSKEFTQDYFKIVNQYWLDELHLDGFRYDYVPGMWKSPTGPGYAKLTFETYQYSKGIPRFQDPAGHSRIIQCAEHLPDPRGVMSSTYSNTAWSNELMDKMADTAIWRYVDEQLAYLFDPQLTGYPTHYSNPATGDSFPVAPFQYVETHDNPRQLARIAPSELRDLIGERYGDRSRFYLLQPYAIGQFMGKGVPMLWQGQELGENWGMAHWGLGRNLYPRDVHWEYFYDQYGQALIRLYRRLGQLRKSLRAVNASGPFFYVNDASHRSQQVIVFWRSVLATATEPEQYVLVYLNFSEQPQEIWMQIPKAGIWVEQLDHGEPTPQPDLVANHAGEWCPVTVPSHYGSVFLL